MAYSRMLAYVNNDDYSGPDIHQLESIVKHRRNGRRWDVQVRWSDGTLTWEPLSIIAFDDFMSCAIYARENNENRYFVYVLYVMCVYVERA